MDTALVAIVGGAVGAGVTGLLQLRRDRVEALRQRQLAAADDYATLLAQVFLRLSARIDSLPSADSLKTDAEREKWLSDLNLAANASRSDLREASAAAPRIELLFGVNSEVGQAALQAIRHLLLMSDALNKRNLDAFNTEYREAANASGRFHRAAHVAIAEGWLKRAWRSLRRTSIPPEEDWLAPDSERPEQVERA